MRTMEELCIDSRVLMQGNAENGISGYLLLQSGQHRMFPFTLNLVYVHHVPFEHVSFQPSMCSDEAAPSLGELEEIKDIFWHKDEEVHFVFPRWEDIKDATGFCKGQSANHWSLWRPHGGKDFS